MPKLEVEMNHDEGMELKDEAVQQVSHFKWLVQSAKDKQLKYTVEATGEGEGNGCDDCMEEKEFDWWEYKYGKGDMDDDEGGNESWCHECDICACMYTCDCDEDHSLCEHIHKVHSYNEKMINEQGPHNIDKSLYDKVAAVKKIVDKVVSPQANKRAKLKRAAFFAELEALEKKYSKFVE